MPARIRDAARLPQNSGSKTPASIAPGIMNITPLSMISITAMERESAAKASFMAVRNAIPPRSNGIMVREYPNRKARTIASAIVTESGRLIAAPSAIPRTSPMEQPVRQWIVALKASRFRDG